MTDPEVNVRIAEWLGTHAVAHGCGEGWKAIHISDRAGLIWTVKDYASGSHEESMPLKFERIPSYTTDLNAIHEAVMKLDIVSRRVFAEELELICKDEMPGDLWGNYFTVQNATASQRAAALCRVLTKTL